MAEIISSLIPGAYGTAQTLTVKFPAGSRKAIVTRTDKPPVLSEILAYDTGPIPPGTADVKRPFISVTQDGRGNVVYDGGFIKFANFIFCNEDGTIWLPETPKTWDELNPSCKYMFNAFNFCANKRKVSNGNKKVLLIGDTYLSDNYCVKASHYQPTAGQNPETAPNGFKDTFTSIAIAGGWDLTIYSMDDTTNGVIDIDYSELDKYALVVYISSFLGAVPATRISDRFVDNLVTLRLTGNGVIVITDDSRNGNYTSIADAAANGAGYLIGANKVVAPYGCYFSGNVDRQPVLVGTIRREMGLPGPPMDHPLFANLADTDYISAGFSESITYPELFTNELVPVDQDLVVPMNTPGTYYVNVLVQLESGDILTKPMRFDIIDPSGYILKDSLNNTLGDITETYKKVFDYTFNDQVNPTETLRGEILRNGNIMGYFESINNKVINYPFSGGPVAVADGDVIGYNILQPFEYLIKTTVQLEGSNELFVKSGSIGTFLGNLNTIKMYESASVMTAFHDMVRLGNNAYMPPAERSLNTNFNWFEEMKRARVTLTNDSIAQCNLYVAVDPASWAGTKPPSPLGAAAIIASTNDVYYYCEKCLDWRLHTQKANELFGINRSVFDPISGKYWVINATNTTAV